MNNNDLLTSVEKCDVIVYFGGEKSNESGEAKSKTNINFNESQLNEIIELKKYNKPIILINSSGRPIILTNVIKHTDSILQTWFLGTKSAEAIYQTLYGINNPSAKLPVTFPQKIGQIPIYYNHLPTGRPKGSLYNEYVSYYIDSSNEPLFNFGFGLSYSNFKYQSLSISKDIIKGDEEVILTVNVKNESNRAGYEIVQLYIYDPFAKISRPVKELKDFRKVWFEENEEKKISFKINKEMFKYYDQNLNYRVDDGQIILYVGTSSNKTLEQKIIFVGGDK